MKRKISPLVFPSIGVAFAECPVCNVSSSAEVVLDPTVKGKTTTFNAKTSVSTVDYGNADSFVENKKAKALEPGVYGNVTVRSGGKLTLNSDGIYFF